LVRTVHGHMVDMVVDVRIGSPTFGKGIMYDMPADISNSEMEWIWVPPGFAHGNYFTKPTAIEYFCTGDYSEGNESGISPLSSDIDWIGNELPNPLELATHGKWEMTDKDRNAPNLAEWIGASDSRRFIYGKCEKG